ncbi:MAG: VanZ family protein [Planctomycetes bacterium]|nr:VanZ family protein [Planctomycetota bacterium]
MRHALPFVVLFVFLALWTWKLLEPSPVPEAVGEVIPTDLKYIASKLAHLCGYSFLTLLIAWLPLRRKQFWVAIALLAGHGILTEVLQYVMAMGRTGKVTDVLIDWTGITLGLLALRLFSRSRDRRERDTQA